MQDLARIPKTNPAEILHQRDGIYAPELLAAAILGLDLFSWLAKTPAQAATICGSLGLAERPADVMLTLFCAMGYLEKKTGAFHLTELARDFLVRESPWFVGPYFAQFTDRAVYQGLIQTLRTGKPGRWMGANAEQAWAEAMRDNAFAEQFTGTMDSRGAYVGPVLAANLPLRTSSHLLDIGGGSGIYACCIVARHPHLRATVFERLPVDRVARNWIARRGFAERVEVRAGDMFRDPLPAAADVHLWSNALHDWDEPTVRRLIAKSFAALPPGGLIVVHDKHLDEDKTGPLKTAAHSVLIMAGTEGRFYSTLEMETFLKEAGFASANHRATTLDYSIITAVKP